MSSEHVSASLEHKNFRNNRNLLNKFQGYFPDIFPTHRKYDAMRQVRTDLRFLRDMYGLRLEMDRRTPADDSNIVPVEKLSLLEAIPAVRAVREEIAKYPPEYIENCDIKRLRLVKGISEKKETVLPGNEVIGIAVQDKQYVYLSYRDQDINVLRITVHHELFHRGDQHTYERAERSLVDNGNRHRQQLKVVFFDRGWANLNPNGEWAYLYDDYTLAPGESHYDVVKGFARRYGKMDEMEDRATIAEQMMMDPTQLLARAATDNVLQRKINRMYKIFSERSGGKMDQNYFLSLSNSKNS